MPFVIEFSGIPDITPTEEFFLTCLLNVYSAPSSLTTRRLRARLFVDAVEKPIKKATFSTSAGATDSNLSIELANIADRSAFTRTASILLYTEEYLAGVWTEIKRYCDGAILATSAYSLQNNGNNPNDTFSVTVQSVLQQLLNLTPEQFHVLYDPAKASVDEAELETVPDEDGESEAVTVTPIASLNLGDVLEYLAVTIYGLTGYKTNLNYEPWALTRVDFPPGQPFWNTIAGIVGNHAPRVSIVDDYLIIADGTLTDYVSARTMALSNFATFQLNKTIERFKGCKLDYQLAAGAWDYYTFRQEIENQPFSDNDAFPLTIIERWYQDFYRLSHPNTPVHSQLFATKQLDYESGYVLVGASNDILSYNFGQSGVRPIRRETKEWAINKVPQAWANYQLGLSSPHNPFAAAGFDNFGGETAYSSASDTVFVNAFVQTASSKTLFNYRPLYNTPNEVYAHQTSTVQRGLVTVDNENPQLEDPYEQEYTKAQQSGNLASGQGSYYGTTDNNQETQRVEKKRSVTIRNRGRSQLNGGIPTRNDNDRRIGDIGDSEIQYETKPLYVRTNGDPTATLWRNVTGGEAPLVVLKPLCHRLNKSQDFPGGVSGDLPTYDETMDIGLVIDPQVDGREAVSVGIFEVIGYTDTLDNISNGGFKTAIQAKQIG